MCNYCLSKWIRLFVLFFFFFCVHIYTVERERKKRRLFSYRHQHSFTSMDHYSYRHQAFFHITRKREKPYYWIWCNMYLLMILSLKKKKILLVHGNSGQIIKVQILVLHSRRYFPIKFVKTISNCKIRICSSQMHSRIQILLPAPNGMNSKFCSL